MSKTAYVVIGESTTLSREGDIILFDHWVEGVYFDFNTARDRTKFLTNVVNANTLFDKYIDFDKIAEHDLSVRFHRPVNYYPSIVSYKIQVVTVVDLV